MSDDVTPEATPEAVGTTSGTTETPAAAPDPVAEAKPETKPGTTQAPVPETYEPFAMPEGVSADAELSESFGGVARSIGLSQDKAQKLVDFYNTTQRRQLEALNDSWTAAVKSDPEIGGAKLDASLAVAAKAIDAFGGAELRQFFDETGMGNHPTMVRLMVNIGKRISEDSFIPGRAGGAETKSAAEILYPGNT